MEGAWLLVCCLAGWLAGWWLVAGLLDAGCWMLAASLQFTVYRLQFTFDRVQHTYHSLQITVFRLPFAVYSFPV